MAGKNRDDTVVDSFEINDYKITLNKLGSRNYSKVSYPIRFGTYSEIETPDYLYQFDLNGKIRFIRPKDTSWPRDEWLKHTAGNDWIFYTPGIYTGLYSFIGEYYLPCFPYESNSIFPYRPFEKTIVKNATGSIDAFIQGISNIMSIKLPLQLSDFLNLVISNNHMNLRAKKFHEIISGRIKVLPPDSRHVDYDVIPVIIADGCLYNCGFCMVKDGKDFKPRTKESITGQIRELRNFYKNNLSNYNSLFLGLNDALCAGTDLIDYTMRNAYESFDFKNSYLNGTNLFIFASVDSFLNSEDRLFKSLNSSPFYTYINIGFESADEETLKFLNKPVETERVHAGFCKMQEINRRYENIEITANFIFSDNLPEGHIPSLLNLNKHIPARFYEKGTIYLSPLLTPFHTDESGIDIKKTFIKIKNTMRMPVYFYLIQRL